jgi:hypothetical protein
MADMKAIRAALAVKLSSTGLSVHANAPGQVTPPTAVIIPDRPAIVYGQTFDGETTVTLLAIVLVSAANDATGQDLIDDYVSSSGTKSINASVQADPTLAGAVESAAVLQVSTYGLVEYAGQQYMGATFLVQIYAHL